MNKVLLVGRLTKDPELKRLNESDKVVCNFTLAVNRNYINEKGEREADFIPVATWGKTAEIIGEYMKKGSLVSVSGKIHIRTYEDKEGNKKYISQVVCDEIQFLEGKNKKEAI